MGAVEWGWGWVEVASHGRVVRVRVLSCGVGMGAVEWGWGWV